MKKLMEIVVYILAIIGFVHVLKHIRVMHCEEGCCMCGWHEAKEEGSKTKEERSRTKEEGSKTKVEGIKIKVEEVKTKAEELKTKVKGFKTKLEGEKRTGSRYGSNPVKY